MKIIFDKKILNYKGTLGNPNRIEEAYKFLKTKYKFIKPEKITDKPLVHSQELINQVREGSGNYFNPDSPSYPDIYTWAILALNSALTAQKLQGFSFIEPPGHHAGKDFFGGFCYFNNIAEAVYRSKLKTLIIDIDGHHGNGTQDIFQNNPDVFFISLHSYPNYPGTGLNLNPDSEENYLNYPLPENCGEKTYLEILKKAIALALKNKKFQPEQIAISAGFDTYKKDSLASLGLEKKSYYKIGKTLKQISKKTNSRIFAVLEGGYSEELGELIHEFLKGLGD
ncbi:histone deacetylase family protein [Candidatus Pacearchaeota archaeon]|nr:histone deacetylase family protein [Candidatus Pacearchaeota archaeon]